MNRIYLIFTFMSITCTFCTEPKDTAQITDMEIKVDMNDPISLKYSQLFDKCTIIPLETGEDNLIGKISDIIIKDDLIFVLDKTMANGIFVFDWDGQLITKISRLGKGAGEYLIPKSITYSALDSLIYVHDSRLSKIITYGVDGSFKEEMRLDRPRKMDEFLYHEGKLFISRRFPEIRSEKLAIMNNQYEIVKTMDINMPGDIDVAGGVPNRVFFNTSNNKGFIYKKFFNNRFLFIDEAQITNSLTVSFPGHDFKLSTEVVHDAPSLFEELMNGKDSEWCRVGDIAIDSKEFMLFGFVFGRKGRISIWDKNQNKGFFIDRLVNDMDKMVGGFRSIGLYNSSANYFINTMDAHVFNQQLSSAMKHSEMDFENNIYKNELENIEVSDMDNPVLFIYKLKPEVQW